MIGKTISHYKILEKLGEGGMGVVYKARDAKLKRTVALKFIKLKALEDEQEKARLVREAQAAAALDHPNICTIYEINEAEGKTFIAMAYIDGQSLREKVKAGPMKIDEALDIATQVGEGLQEAHEKGIIHRDIKSGNIMVTKKGQAKIMDFGLAKLTGETKITRTGITMGTIAYMSPEQIHGEELDHRTDIWSFGVMLYEMLSGQLPFQKENQAAMIYSVLNDQPKPFSSIRSEIPKNVEQVINKALQKDRTQRYQSMRELMQDLKKPPPAVIELPKAEKSIVILPFEDISPGRDNEYFSDGLMEEIITDLSKVHSLRVISRSSAMTFKGARKKVKEIARDVNVQYVLEGSVRKAGNNLRITAQLIDAAGDKHLWAEKYKGTLDDVFDIQEKVSRSIVDALKLKLTPVENKKIAERPIEDVHAYDCYLRARQEIWRWTEGALDRALQYLQNGLDIGGENSLLYAGMGYVYWNYVNLGIKQEDYIEKAEECVKKAFKLNPDSQKGHFLLGIINMAFRGNQQKSIRHLKRALVIDSNDPDALIWLALGYAGYVGKTFAALPLVERLLQIDPFNAGIYSIKSLLHVFEGRYDAALEALRKAYQMEPEDPSLQYCYALVLAYNKCFKEAYAIIDQSEKISPENVHIQICIFLKYALQGKKKEALQSMRANLRITARRDGWWSWNIAEALALINEKDKAFDWLENAISRGFINYPMLSKYDPFLENIRGEERFKKLMERVKHEWENFEV